MPIVSRAQCDAMRESLGYGVTMKAVAAKLGITIWTLRRKYKYHELKKWDKEIKAKQKEALIARSAKRVKSMALRLGRLPRAKESGILPSTIKSCGGYTVIVRAAGFVPRQPGKVGAKHKVLNAHKFPVTKVRHWQEAK